jgi:hypothetical protein
MSECSICTMHVYIQIIYLWAHVSQYHLLSTVDHGMNISFDYQQQSRDIIQVSREVSLCKVCPTESIFISILSR